MASRKRKSRSPTPPRAAAAADPSTPKTTRPVAANRREVPRARDASERIRRKLDAFPDKIDIRDWMYQPTLAPLPDRIVNTPLVPSILDQGNEGACTGFALAAVINFQLAARKLLRPNSLARMVSPRMLYEMARRYDEWPGEKYEGSSARGAIKGWIAHGVATSTTWPDKLHGHGNLTDEIADEARRTPGGAYYRVMHRNVRDIHAAIAEAGIVYATLMVHEGWDHPGFRNEKDSDKNENRVEVQIDFTYAANVEEITLPVICRRGRADSGHAIALVGYTRDGFIIQNSWGSGWGTDGFALLPYEDWLMHATDCWVAQLGVPVSLDLWKNGLATETTAGQARAQEAIPLADIRPYVVDIGNNGRLSDSGQYWTTREDISRLFESIQARTSTWKTPRIMLYMHGGLNDEAATARRIVAFRDVLLANEIYPIHIMWETGFWESLKSGVLDLFTSDDERSGANWLKKMRDGLIEAKDRTIELTAAVPGAALWREMKENARLSVATGGGFRILVEVAKKVLAGFPTAERKKWELHVVGHSAGSIFAAYAVESLIDLGINFKSLQLMAPAIRTDLFKERVVPLVKGKQCPQPTVYLLSDVGERDDTVGPYGKSLLYLVSNAFEGRRESPILGMQRFVTSDSPDPNKELVDKELEQFLAAEVAKGLPSLIVAGAARANVKVSPNLSRSESHGGFDNDESTLNSVLYRILGNDPPRPFELRDLQY